MTIYKWLVLSLVGVVSCAKLPGGIFAGVNDPATTPTTLPTESNTQYTSTTTSLSSTNYIQDTPTTLPTVNDTQYTPTTLPTTNDTQHTPTTLPTENDTQHTLITLPAETYTPPTLSNQTYTVLIYSDEELTVTPATPSEIVQRWSEVPEMLKDPSSPVSGALTDEPTFFGVAGRGDDTSRNVYNSDNDDTDDYADYNSLKDNESDREAKYEYEDEGDDTEMEDNEGDDTEMEDNEGDDTEMEDNEGDDTEMEDNEGDDTEMEDNEGDDTENDDDGDGDDAEEKSGGSSDAKYSGDDDDDDDTEDDYNYEETLFDNYDEYDEDDYDNSEYDGYIKSYWDINDEKEEHNITNYNSNDEDDNDNEDHSDGSDDKRDNTMDNDNRMAHMYHFGNESSDLTPMHSSGTQGPQRLLASEDLHISRTITTTDADIGSEGLVETSTTEGEEKQPSYYHSDESIARGETVIMLSDTQLRHLQDLGTSGYADEDQEEYTERYDYEDKARGEESTTFLPVENSRQETTGTPAFLSSDTAHYYKTDFITNEELEHMLKSYPEFLFTGEQWENGQAGEEDFASTERDAHYVTGEIIDEERDVTKLGLNYTGQERNGTTQGEDQHDGRLTLLSLSAPTEINYLEVTNQTRGNRGVLNTTTQNFTVGNIQEGSQGMVIPDMSQTYNELVKSDQLTAEERQDLSDLERLRRTVEALGGEKTLHKNLEIHHIVRRQLQGHEACKVLNRRRRTAENNTVEEHSEAEKFPEYLVRVRRGVSNVGKSLEQGTARYKQLLNQYKKVCDFIALTFFDK
ncbi:putative surface protein SACOL0050 [Cherax quadricarinatus]|uniref:putative surface protein SACOL0050 n=1 Tax=Cherax quadricarinatus TaxID=27406 RepID=UPI00387E89D4